MTYTLVTSVLCGRGSLTTVLSGMLGTRSYVVSVNPFPFPDVQYRGTFMIETDDTSSSVIPQELTQSVQLYRPFTRITTIGYGGVFVGIGKLWLPRNFRYSTAICNLYLIS
jgi:hypothetical protein